MAYLRSEIVGFDLSAVASDVWLGEVRVNSDIEFPSTVLSASAVVQNIDYTLGYSMNFWKLKFGVDTEIFANPSSGVMNMVRAIGVFSYNGDPGMGSMETLNSTELATCVFSIYIVAVCE